MFKFEVDIIAIGFSIILFALGAYITKLDAKNSYSQKSKEINELRSDIKGIKECIQYQIEKDTDEKLAIGNNLKKSLESMEEYRKENSHWSPRLPKSQSDVNYIDAIKNLHINIKDRDMDCMKSAEWKKKSNE